MGRLTGKVAVVTGDAAGIGEADCRLMAREGAKVVITTCRKVDEGRKVAEDIKREGGEATFIKLDVRKEEDWKTALDETIKKYGKLNILVNNAAISEFRTIEETSLTDWNRTIEVNATGVFLGTKYAIEVMKKNGEPCSIINIASAEVWINEPEFFAYNAAKGAVKCLSSTAALHCARKGYNIRVNTVYPGYIRTPMTIKEAEDAGMTEEDYFAQAIQNTPLGHVGEPNDIAYLVLYLASDESKFATGADFNVDGGITIP